MTAAAQSNSFRAPLYWSVYENQILKEQTGQHDIHVSEADWLAGIDWVEDGPQALRLRHGASTAGATSQLNENGYRLSHSRHWEHDYAWWSEHLQKRGMRLGMYGNPLWIHVADDDAPNAKSLAPTSPSPR